MVYILYGNHRLSVYLVFLFDLLMLLYVFVAPLVVVKSGGLSGYMMRVLMS